jgi:hypothetical protein
MDDDPTDPMDLIAAILRFHHILEARLDRALNGCGLSFASTRSWRPWQPSPIFTPASSAGGSASPGNRRTVCSDNSRKRASSSFCRWTEGSAVLGLPRRGRGASTSAGAPSRASSARLRDSPALRDTTCARPSRTWRRPWFHDPALGGSHDSFGYIVSSRQNSEKPSTYRSMSSSSCCTETVHCSSSPGVMKMPRLIIQENEA